MTLTNKGQIPELHFELGPPLPTPSTFLLPRQKSGFLDLVLASQQPQETILVPRYTGRLDILTSSHPVQEARARRCTQVAGVHGA